MPKATIRDRANALARVLAPEKQRRQQRGCPWCQGASVQSRSRLVEQGTGREASVPCHEEETAAYRWRHRGHSANSPTATTMAVSSTSQGHLARHHGTGASEDAGSACAARIDACAVWAASRSAVTRPMASA